MAWRSERWAARHPARAGSAHVVIAVVAVIATIGPSAVVAEPRCDGSPTISLLTARYGLAPPRPDRLGLDLLVRAVEVGWGGGCDARRHQVELSEAEAPSYGERGRSVIRLGAYRRSWSRPGWTVHLGLRAASRWGDAWRFATPIVGGSVRHGDLRVTGELEVGGLSLIGGDVRRGLRSDLVVEARAVWPERVATRGELRVRARDLAMSDTLDLRDLTVSAGLGLAAAAREQARALPGFVGLALRLGEDARGLVVLEWNLGVGPR